MERGQNQKNGNQFSRTVSKDHSDQVTGLYHHYSQILSDLSEIPENRKKQ